MAIHLTPTELGREAGMHRREVIAKCMELGVPIFQGRIDKTLFMSSVKELQGKAQLAKRLTVAINKTLKQKEGFGGISNTYFTSFVVQ